MNKEYAFAVGLVPYYYAHAHKRIAQLCTHMSINDIPDRDGCIHTYVHHENRSLIQSFVLMRSALINELKEVDVSPRFEPLISWSIALCANHSAIATCNTVYTCMCN